MEEKKMSWLQWGTKWKCGLESNILQKMGMLGSHIVGKMGLMMTKMDILQKSNCYGRTHVSGNNSSAESVKPVENWSHDWADYKFLKEP